MVEKVAQGEWGIGAVHLKPGNMLLHSVSEADESIINQREDRQRSERFAYRSDLIEVFCCDGDAPVQIRITGLDRGHDLPPLDDRDAHTGGCLAIDELRRQCLQRFDRGRGQCGWILGAHGVILPDDVGCITVIAVPGSTSRASSWAYDRGGRGGWSLVA